MNLENKKLDSHEERIRNIEASISAEQKAEKNVISAKKLKGILNL